MFTLLSIQTVSDGREDDYLRIQREVWKQTHAKEPGIIRYEHYRGEKPGKFYSFLTFRDFDAFLDHQVADYHDSPDWMGMFKEHELQILDPVPGANGLTQTDIPRLETHMDELRRQYAAMIPDRRPDWWGEIDRR